MTTDPKKRQKKLAKRAKKKRGKVLSSKKQSFTFGERLSPKKALLIAQNSPIHNCYLRKDIFAEGLGTAIISRQMPDNSLGCSFFLLDVWCLGVKNAFFTVLSESEYEDHLYQIGDSEELEVIHPSCIRKVTEQCIDYAMTLGFKPHKDYKTAGLIFKDIDSTACPNRYTFGKDGKPFYIAGPNESESDSMRIIKTLSRKCGDDNFHCMTVLPMDDDDWNLD